ncbi:hypothetical protein MTO96_010313 [Rhipicephalus appendiculatus]
MTAVCMRSYTATNGERKPRAADPMTFETRRWYGDIKHEVHIPQSTTARCSAWDSLVNQRLALVPDRKRPTSAQSVLTAGAQVRQCPTASGSSCRRRRDVASHVWRKVRSRKEIWLKPKN